MVTRLDPRRLLAFALLAFWQANPGITAESEGSTLAPYEATYRTKAMGLNVTVKRKLTSVGTGYRLSSEGSSFLASLSEVAHFDLVDGQIRGRDYLYVLKSLVRRRREVVFLPNEGVIKSLRKDVWTEHAWSPEVLDQFSQQEQLRLDLSNAASSGNAAPKELSFKVVDGARMKNRVLELVAEEILPTSLGDLTTLHYRQRRASDSNRSSDVWVAPSLDFMMVLTRHIEDDSLIEIAIESLSVSPAPAR